MRISEIVKQKSKNFVKNGKILKEIETPQRIHFTVLSKDLHSVIFDKKEKSWSCDCQFFSLKQKPCSHILACKLYLNLSRKNIYGK
ncbi:MAG: SWIM zinc finger domain-containing protein [Candidatus Aenigmarchaeota archaeon]|nr:SWIM zinc finger domain-containing protein [Candidatus Aenigmarchaeota archaeon]